MVAQRGVPLATDKTQRFVAGIWRSRVRAASFIPPSVRRLGRMLGWRSSRARGFTLRRPLSWSPLGGNLAKGETVGLRAGEFQRRNGA